jgi:tetratricopeptide (TPR) repeat protein
MDLRMPERDRCEGSAMLDLGASRWVQVLLSRLLLISALTGILSTALASSPDLRRPQGKMLAILIGVSSYNHVRDVHWAVDDVERVSAALQRWCNCDRNDIVVMTNRSPQRYQPTRGNILFVLTDKLQQLDRAGYDRVLIYFAGHGVKGADGNLYLAPQDHVALLTPDTGLRVAVVREALKRSGNVTKFLVLDACHAGETRNIVSSLSGEIGEELRVTQGLLTFASCQPDEESIGWHKMRQGLFTHWFCLGLSGAADQVPYGNGDGVVDTDELAHFVRVNVKRTADELGHRQQPLVIPSHGWKGPSALAVLGGAADQREQVLQGWRHVEQALKYRNGANFPDALAELEPAFRLWEQQPELRELHALRGRFHVERGKVKDNLEAFRAALLDLDQAIRTSRCSTPPHELAAFYALRCEAHYGLQCFEAALDDATQVIAHQPGSAQAYRNRAKLLKILGHDQRAREDEQKAETLAIADTPAASPTFPAATPAIESSDPMLKPSAESPTVELRNPTP